MNEQQKHAVRTAVDQAYSELRWVVGDSKPLAEALYLLARDSFAEGLRQGREESREDLNDARNGWEHASAELNDAAQCIANQCQTIGRLQRELADMSVINSIDDRFNGRLAFMLECAILDPHGCFDEACRLLDDYKSEWEKVSPSPPTFMGEPRPHGTTARSQ